MFVGSSRKNTDGPDKLAHRRRNHRKHSRQSGPRSNKKKKEKRHTQGNKRAWVGGRVKKQHEPKRKKYLVAASGTKPERPK